MLPMPADKYVQSSSMPPQVMCGGIDFALRYSPITWIM